MPFWITLLATITTLIILIGGAFSFPYVPMFFGVYDGLRHTPRGKLILLLIWLFIPVSLLCVVLAWTSHGVIALLPLAHIALAWSLRLNKNMNEGPSSVYKTESDNLKARLDEISSQWTEWSRLSARTPQSTAESTPGDTLTQQYYLLCHVHAPHNDAAIAFRDLVTEGETLYSAVERQTYDNNTATLYVRIPLRHVDKALITDITKRIVNAAWRCQCEVLSVDVMEADY